MSGDGKRPLEVTPRRFTALRGDLLTAVLAAPIPPGSRLAIPLPGTAAGGARITGKVVAERRAPEGGIEIDIRLHSLSRGQRSLLTALVSPPA